jgi:hypothetical protein
VQKLVPKMLILDSKNEKSSSKIANIKSKSTVLELDIDTFGTIFYTLEPQFWNL